MQFNESNLFHAVIEGNEEAIRLILSANPTLAKSTFLGHASFLQLAATEGKLSIAVALLEHGADVNALSRALLFDVALSEAAQQGHLEIVKFLLQNGAFIDGADPTSVSPLMLAAREGHLDIVQCLLDAGAEVNRLGCVQRFLPVDFSGWHQSVEVEKLLRSHGGVSVTEEYDWEHQRGFPVIAHVSNNAGAVYPLAFTRQVRDALFAFRLAEVRAKDKPLFLFSAGLYEFGQPIDIALALHTRWPLRQTYLNEKSKFSFPLDVLHKLVCCVADGLLITPGMMLSRDDPRLADLAWPDGVAALIAVDHIWPVDKKSAAPGSTSNPSSDEVKILTLAPVLQTAKPIQDKDTALQWAEKMRTASWKKITLPLSY